MREVTKKDLRQAPYYDDYESSKQYTQILARPGRVAQSREITQIQSTMKDIMKSIGDSFLNDGDIVEGCQIIPDKTNKTVTVTAGRVYMSGMVLNLKESTISIKGEGVENIGVRLVESIVTEEDDASLRDPALSYDNFNQPGGDRLKSELKIVNLAEDANSDNFALLAKLVDGEVSLGQQAPNYSTLNETLARRTYDESGSYIVEGLIVRVETNEDESKFSVVVESGKAYVHGYEVNIPSARRVILPRSITSATVSTRYSYNTGSRYLLTTGPYVKNINKVVGSLEVTESVTINSNQGASLRNNTAYSIISVTKGGTTYPASKYRLEQGPTSYIKWTDTDYPGDNVVVKYYYTAEFQEGRDYKLTLDTTNNSYYMDWMPSSPLSPVVGETITIEHEKYLARKDTVYIDQYGVIDAIQGIPADYGLEVAPSAPTYTLPLASIMSPPGGLVDKTDESLDIGVSSVGLTRFTMRDIHNLLKRIRTMEYDQTILSLNTEAKDYATDDKRGIFTDPFIDLSKISLDFNKDIEGHVISEDRPYFDVGIDLDSNMIHLPLIPSYADANYDSAASSVNKYFSTVTLRKTGERVVLSQMNATKSFLIAPYISHPQTPEVHINPSLDTWYDDTYIQVPVSINQSKVVSTSSRTVYSTRIDPSFHQGGLVRTEYSGVSTDYSAVGTTTQKLISDSIIKENIVEYIRQREITVQGTNYPPSLDNIKCYFEGVFAPMTPLSGTSAGTQPGSVKANSNGSFDAKFTIPQRINTGTRVVKFESQNKIEGYESSAYAYYKATGIARTIQRTITTITTVLLHRTDTEIYQNYYYDPLAQTFVLDETTIVNGIDIYFESLPDANLPVTCEIREVSNGNITATVYGTKTLMANDIRANVSSNSSKATRFTFDDPVLCEANKEYAFVLKANSKDFRVYVAEIGETDLQTNQLVANNPYIQGVMMSSSNNSSWTIHQKADVKFRIIADTYDANSEVVFDTINIPEGFCRFNLAAESLVFENTRLEWYYSLDGGLSYDHISPYTDRVVDALANSIKLKASIFKTANTNLSPILNLNSVSLNLSRYDNSKEGYYVSNLISGLDEYNNLEIILDTYDPSGTDMKVYMSTNQNNETPYTLNELTLQSSRELSYNWTEKTYKVTLGFNATRCRIFVKLSSSLGYHTPAFRRLRAIMS